MRNLGFHGNTVNLMVAGGVNIVQFFAVFPAILYIDRWGGWSAQLNTASSSATRSLLDRKKATSPHRQRHDDHIASAHCPIGKLEISLSIGERLNTWRSSNLAVNGAIMPLQLGLPSGTDTFYTLPPLYSEFAQLRIPFHSCLWHQFWTCWLGPSKRSVPTVDEGQRCCTVDGIKLAE